MDIITLAVPFVVTGIMFVVKRLAGLAWFNNGAQAVPVLRLALVLFSLIGTVSTHLLTGEPINADSISSLATIAVTTVISAFGSHVIYRIISFFTPSQTA